MTNGTVARFYIDGVLVKTLTVVGVTWDAGATGIGGRYDNTGAYNFDGLIQHVRVFDKALSQAEIDFLHKYPAGNNPAAPVGQDPGKESLVGYWPLDEIEGTRVTDSSGNGFDGTLVAGTGWADGKVGNAYHFDNGSSINIPTSLGALTAWSLRALVNADTLTPTDGDNKIIELRQSSDDDRTCLYFDSDSTNKLCFYFTDGTAKECQANAAAAASTWYDVVGTYDGTTFRLYVNAILQTDTETASSKTLTPNENAIGATSNALTTNNFDGLIDEVRVYSKALSPAEVLFLFQNPGGSPKGLVTRNDVAVGEINAKHLLYGGYKSLITNDELWDEDDGELFTLGFDLISDGGRAPVEKLVHKEPAILRTSDEVEYNNPRARQWDGLADDPYTDTIGIYDAATNLVPYPEDSAEWDNDPDCTDETLEETFDGVPWIRVICSNSNTTYIEDIFEFGTDPISVRCVVRKGPDQTGTARILVYDASIAATGAGWCDVQINFGAGTVSEGASGSGISVELVEKDWILANEIVSVSFIANGLSTGEADTELRLYPDETEAAGRYADFCMIQVEDNPYPTPYCFDTRPAGILEYKKNLKDEGAIECWVRPRFTYDDGEPHIVWQWYKGPLYYFMLFYNPSTDEFQVSYNWGVAAAGKTLVQGVNYTNSTLWDWIHIKVAWKFSTDVGKLRVDSESKDADWSDTPPAYAGDGWRFFVGCGALSGFTDPFDGEIADLAIRDVVDETDTHVDADKPWMGQYDVPNYDQSVVISRKALKLTRAELSVIDKKNRTIDVGSQGILARDRVGNKIHDIPEGMILNDMAYLGHIYLKKAIDGFDGLTVSATDTETTLGPTTSAVQNYQIDTNYPAGLDNPSGGGVAC